MVLAKCIQLASVEIVMIYDYNLLFCNRFVTGVSELVLQLTMYYFYLT